MQSQLDFKQKYVAFIDVLGFSEMVFKDSNDELKDYFNTAGEIFETFSHYKGDLQKMMISDSIILVSEKNEEGLRTILTAIQTLQAKMAAKGIFMRGGLSFGEVAINVVDKLIVGKGYIKAFLLEGIAKYPRVIIDPSIISDLGKNREEFIYLMNYHREQNNWCENEAKLIHDNIGNSRVRYTSDDAIFVDYARKIILTSFHDFKDNYDDSPLCEVYHKLKTKIYGEQQHYHKYVWLKKFFAESIFDSLAMIPNPDDLYTATWFENKHRQFLEL